MSDDLYSFFHCVTSELEIDFAVHDANTDRFSEKIRNGWKLTAHARLAMNLMRGRSHFIDIGANIGTFSIPVSMSTGARCLDVEALPSNIPLLEANLERNGVDNHEIAHVAAMDRAGSVFIKGTTAFGTVNTNGEGVEVPGVRLDDIVMGTEFEHAALVKIDIEGSELRALMGLEQFFANSGPDHIIFEGNGAHCAAQGYMPRDLIRFFHDRGYTVYLVGGSRLSKRTPDDFQEAALRDYVATRLPVDDLPGFSIGEVSLDTRAQLTSRVAGLAIGYRLFMAKELQFAPAELAAHSLVQETINLLLRDEAATVREAIEAWHD